MYREPAARPKNRLPKRDRGDEHAPEVIARIVRNSFGRFLRVCYEDALRSHPALEGKVTIRFEIGIDGAVWRAEDQGSDIPDPALVACVVRAAANLSFPRPGNYDETVTLPLYFRPPG